MNVLKAVVNWFLGTYVGRLILAYANSQAGNYASSLAFTAFVSMFPLILGILAIVGFATHDTNAEGQFLHTISSFFPADTTTQKSLHDALDAVRHNAGILGIIGLLGLLWSGSSLFTSMEWTIGRMIGARQRDFLRQRAMTLIMTLIYVVAIVANIVFNSALSLLPGSAKVGPLFALIVWIAFMAVVYRFVPNHTYRLRQMWPGILLAGGLMELLSLLWPLYTGLTHGFNTYGKTFALFFLLAAWVYFLAQFILLGAVANRMHAGRPCALGVIAMPEKEQLETEATRAADQYGRQPHRQAA